MSTYSLHVIHADAPSVVEIVSCEHGRMVVDLASQLLARHPGCKRVDVQAEGVLLFSIDRDSARRAG